MSETTTSGMSESYDVFISYSSRDVDIANDVCAFLEETGLKCWIAPRNIVPGREYGENISDAIPRSKCLCLIFSSNSNASPHVASEVAMAFDKRVNILPVRIEDIPMNEDLGYRLNRFHQVSAIGGDVRGLLPDLPQQVRTLMAGKGRGVFVNHRTARTVAIVSILVAIGISLSVSYVLRPKETVSPGLSIFHKQTPTKKALIDEEYAGISVGEELQLQPSEHEGYHRYILEILSDGTSSIYPEELFGHQGGPLRNQWGFLVEGDPGPLTVMLLVSKDSLEDDDRTRILESIAGIGMTPTMGDAGQIIWSDGNWRSLEDAQSRGPKDVAYDPTWANELLRVLNSEKDLHFAGKTLSAKP